MLAQIGRFLQPQLLRVVFLSVVASCLWSQQPEKNPYTKHEDIVEGRRLYSFDCVTCHGMDGASGRGARLASKYRRYGSTDREMFRTISEGITDTEMPGLWRDDESVWKILAFVRTLELTATEACSSAAGNSEKGRDIFVNKGSCTICHTVGMSGGRLGPDLTVIGATRSFQYLRDSLLDPNKDIPYSHQTVRAVDIRGRRFEGILLNEDGYTLHLLDRQEEIRSLSKTNLREFSGSKESLMPSYGDRLTEIEMNDLLSYLCALTSSERRAAQ